MSKYNTYEQIKAYLYNGMSVEDRTAFEAALQRDRAFAEQFEDLKLDFQLKEAILKEDLLENLKRWDEVRKDDVDEEEKSDVKNAAYTKYIVGGVVLLLLAGLGYYLRESPEIENDKKRGITPGNTEFPIGTAVNDDSTNIAKLSISDTETDMSANDSTGEIAEKDGKINSEKEGSKQEAPTTTALGDTVDEDPKKVTPSISNPEVSPDPIKIESPPEIKEPTPESADSSQIYAAEINKDIKTWENSDETIGTRSTDIDSLAAIVEADSSDSASKYDLGLGYYQQDSLDKAIKYLKAFNEAQPDHSDIEHVQLILCMAYLEKKQLDKAKPSFDAIITIEQHMYHKKYGDKLKVIWDSIDTEKTKH